MGTMNIINQEQAGKLGQNQQAVGKKVKLLYVHIYIYLEKKLHQYTLKYSLIQHIPKF